LKDSISLVYSTTVNSKHPATTSLPFHGSHGYSVLKTSAGSSKTGDHSKKAISNSEPVCTKSFLWEMLQDSASIFCAKIGDLPTGAILGVAGQNQRLAHLGGDGADPFTFWAKNLGISSV